MDCLRYFFSLTCSSGVDRVLFLQALSGSCKKEKKYTVKTSILFPVRQATAMYPYINEKDSNCADYKQSLDVK